MVVCEVHLEKDDPDCTRITIGGNSICFLGKVGTNTASLELFKLLLNSVLSCPGARFSSINLKNFYVDTPMPYSEYVRIKIADILAKFIEEYNLQGCNCDRWMPAPGRHSCQGSPPLLPSCQRILQGQIHPRPLAPQMASHLILPHS
jgi:hypothetical protein